MLPSSTKRSLSAGRRAFTNLFRLALAGLLFATVAVIGASKAPSTLDRVIDSGELRMISRNGPTTYYQGAQGMTGFEYALALGFAEDLGVELIIDEQENLATMLGAVGSQKADFAAAGLTITEARQQQVRFSSSYFDINQQLLYNARTPKPKSPQDLIGKNILVVANSAHSERLKVLQQEFPALRWREQSNLEMLDLIEMVHKGEIDFTIVDSNAFDINKGIYPRAQVAFDISEPQQLAWAFSKHKDDSLYQAAERYLFKIRADGTLSNLKEEYYGHASKISYGGALTFADRVDERLPKYEEKIKEIAAKHDLDWRLLAAISYQESHWNPRARSYTGVRGMMMLTRTTAKELKVKNRLDAEQSLDGGARYFKKILRRLPERINEPDKTWLALAAYNVGYGHMEDARQLTEQLGGDPDSWADVREHLPKLAKRKFYRSLKHGYARGWEPVTYVQNIRTYHNILAWHEQHNDIRYAEGDSQEIIQQAVLDSVDDAGLSVL